MVYLDDRGRQDSSSGMSSCNTFAKTTLARLDCVDSDQSITGLIRAQHLSLARHEFELARIDSKMRKVEKREMQLRSANISVPAKAKYGSSKIKLHRRGISPFFSADKPVYTVLAERTPTIIRLQKGHKQGIHSSHASIVSELPKDVLSQSKIHSGPRHSSTKWEQEQKANSEARRQSRVARFSEYLNEAIERKLDVIMESKLKHCQCRAEQDGTNLHDSAQTDAIIPVAELPQVQSPVQSESMPDITIPLRDISSQDISTLAKNIPARTTVSHGIQAATEVRDSATQTRYSCFPAAGLEQSLPLVVKRYKHRSTRTDLATSLLSETESKDSGTRRPCDASKNTRIPVARYRQNQIPDVIRTQDLKRTQLRVQVPRHAYAAPLRRAGVILQPSPLGQDSTDRLDEPTVIQVSRPKERTRREHHESSVSLGLKMENNGAFDGKRYRNHKLGLKSKQGRGRLRLWLFGV